MRGTAEERLAAEQGRCRERCTSETAPSTRDLRGRSDFDARRIVRRHEERGWPHALVRALRPLDGAREPLVLLMVLHQGCAGPPPKHGGHGGSPGTRRPAQRALLDRFGAGACGEGAGVASKAATRLWGPSLSSGSGAATAARCKEVSGSRTRVAIGAMAHGRMRSGTGEAAGAEIFSGGETTPGGTYLSELSMVAGRGTTTPTRATQPTASCVDEGGMETTLPSFLAPDLPTLVFRCAPFGARPCSSWSSPSRPARSSRPSGHCPEAQSRRRAPRGRDEPGASGAEAGGRRPVPSSASGRRTGAVPPS